mgnify:CR=1 FL=1
MIESTIRSAITPPQARQVVGRKAKLGQKLPKLVDHQSFREHVGCLKIGTDMLKIGTDMLKIDIPCNGMFSDEVVVHLDVLCPSMEYRVPSQVDVAKIVAVD